MTLMERIEQETTAALKARDADRVATLRYLRAALQNDAIQRKKKSLTDEETLAVIQREAKRRRESIEQYAAGGRDDLAAKERAELAILGAYLPAQLDADAIRTKIDAVLASNPTLRNPAKRGVVMGKLMPDLRGRADGKLVQTLVADALTRQA